MQLRSAARQIVPHLELAASKESSKAFTIHNGTQAGYLSATPTHVRALLHVQVSHTIVRAAALNKYSRSFVHLCFLLEDKKNPDLKVPFEVVPNTRNNNKDTISTRYLTVTV